MYTIKPLEWTINNTAANRLEFFEYTLLKDGRYQLEWLVFDSNCTENLDCGNVERFSNLDDLKARAEEIHQSHVKEFLVEEA